MSEPRVTRREEKLGQALGRDLGDTFARRDEMPFDDLVEAFRAVEDSYLVQFETNQLLALETKRRVAEMMLMAGTDKRCTYEKCRSQLDNLFQLGFTNLERKVTMCIFFARYCRATNHPREGIEFLEPLIGELQSELNRSGIRRSEKEFYGGLLDNTEAILRKLHDSLNATT
jgi:hypothetical protein